MRTAVLVLIVLLAPQLAAAQSRIIDKRLQLALNPEFVITRGHAPIALRATLNWTAPQLLDGRLRLSWYVDRIRLGTYLSPELALANTEYTLSVLLPPAVVYAENMLFTVRAEFVTEDAVYDLEERDIAVPVNWRRQFVVCVCRAFVTSTVQEGVVWTDDVLRPRDLSVDLEQFFPADAFTRREVATHSVEVEPADMPRDALRLTALDILMLMPDGFSKLKAEQLDAVATWTEAGGSVAVVATGVVPKAHVEFLNRLAGGDLADARYVRTPTGRILSVETPGVSEASGVSGRLQRFRAGLGRAVVSLEHPDFASGDWTETVLFLWKVRRQRITETAGGRFWPVGEMRLQENTYISGTLEPHHVVVAQQLEDLLLPQTIRGIPFITVCLLLVAFLAVIAPGDYFLLGWLKRRRWTWVVFPVVSLGFTWYTVRLAGEHLGATNYRNHITIVDVGDDGRPLRTSRFEMLYTATTQQHRQELTQSLMVPIHPDWKSSEDRFRRYEPRPQYDEPWEVNGWVPRHYEAQRNVRQWSPRMSRTTTFGSGEGTAAAPLSQFDFASITTADLRTEEGRIALWDQFRAAAPSARLVIWNRGQAWKGDRAQPTDNRSTTDQLLQIIRRAGGPRRGGLYEYVSQVSPSGAGTFEDLALVDDSDPRQWLLLVLVEAGEGEYVAWRRLLVEEA